MKKLLIGLLFSICGVSHAITYQAVRASTSNVVTPSLQTGTMNLSSGTVTNLNTTTLKGATGTFTGAVTAGSFSPASAIPSGSTQYIQNQVAGTQANSGFNVSTGTISSGTITAATIGTAIISSETVTNQNVTTSTITTLTGTNVGISSMTTTLPMSGRKITGLANGTVSTDGAAFGQIITNPAVQFRVNTASATASTTYVPTNVTLSFTPSSASHRVKVTFSGTCSNSASSTGRGLFTIFQNGVDMASSANGMAGVQIVGAVNDCPCHMTVIGSPATTSAVTYTVYMKAVATATIGVAPDSEDSTLIAEEIY